MVLNLSVIRSWLLELMFPSKCVSCGLEGKLLCEICVSKIKRVDELITVPYLNGVYALYRYEDGGVLQKAVKALKYRLIRGVAEYFRTDLEVFLEENFSSGYLIVPVPLHPKREKWRGFNQAAELTTGLPVIKRVRHTKCQAELSRNTRLENLRGAFEVCVDICGEKIVLIDDVCTTGATLSECARALKEAGAREVWGVVLGHG